MAKTEDSRKLSINGEGKKYLARFGGLNFSFATKITILGICLCRLHGVIFASDPSGSFLWGLLLILKIKRLVLTFLSQKYTII